MDVEDRMVAAEALPRSVAIRNAQPSAVLVTVGDVLGDPRAALLTGRVGPDKAGCWLRRRESLVTHGAPSVCVS
jgi:hypothetical protein